jgi:hypothetical protein
MSPRRSGLDPGPVRVILVLVTAFSPIASVFPCSGPYASPSFYYCETDKQTQPRSLQTKQCCLGYLGGLNRKWLFLPTEICASY